MTSKSEVGTRYLATKMKVNKRTKFNSLQLANYYKYRHRRVTCPECKLRVSKNNMAGHRQSTIHIMRKKAVPLVITDTVLTFD